MHVFRIARLIISATCWVDNISKGTIVTYISHVPKEISPQKLVKKMSLGVVFHKEVLGKIIWWVNKLVIPFGRVQSGALYLS